MTKKYVVARKDVCAGQLIKPFKEIGLKAFDMNGRKVSIEELEKQGFGKIEIFGGLICRGMLYSVNEDGLSNDLIYNSPNYPIEGIEPKVEIESDIIINNHIKLEELLKYLKYDEHLTQKDLYKIFKMFITSNRWLRKNIELFGWLKTEIGHVSGGTEIISREIYDKLGHISCGETGKPHNEEPDYILIKKKSRWL